MSQRILTGHRPTGPRHLGHLVGTLASWKTLQETHECYFLVADLHVLTSELPNPEQILKNTLNMLADWLAAGVDPHRATIVLQSIIPEHAQLALLFSMLTTVSRLERIPTYKEQTKMPGINPSLGMLTYPVLQAADILLYKATHVPVGEDQLPHLELTREIARRFNARYAGLFPEPEALLSTTPRLPGVDNRMMHASYGNAIYLCDSAEETTRKVMSMYTDPNRIHADDPGQVEGNPLFVYLDAFGHDQNEIRELKRRYQSGTVGDVSVKQYLAAILNDYLFPMRERRAEYIARPRELLEVLYSGTVKAKFVAQQTLEEVHEHMGLLHSQSISNQVLSNNISGIF